MFTNCRKFAIFRLSSDLYREISLVVFYPIFAITVGTELSKFVPNMSNHNVILEFDGFPHEISRSFFVQGLGKGTVIESSRQHFEQIFPPTGSTNLLAFCTCLLNVEETDLGSGLPKLLFQNREWSLYGSIFRTSTPSRQSENQMKILFNMFSKKKHNVNL